MNLRHLFNALRWVFLTLGALLFWLGLRTSAVWLAFLLVVLGVPLLALSLLMFWWALRPNRSAVDTDLKMESWDVFNDHWHRSNVDLICWNDTFYLVHAVSPFHFASTRCYLSLNTSSDGRSWQEIARFHIPGEDIRDPKLAVIDGRMILYVLANRSFDPEPYTTLAAISTDEGKTWSTFKKLEPQGWLFWKPKTLDGITWYVPAYWWEHGKSRLFATTDGVKMSRVASINEEGERNDETDIEFLADGNMIATARIEGDFQEWGYGMFFGHPGGGTQISAAEPPYTRFTALARSTVTRLDGPALFRYNGRVYAVGRRQPEFSQPFLRQGSIFARKRTAIFEVTQAGLTWLSDVPSAGDTAYAGVVLKEGCLYFAYYSSNIHRDFPWIAGMLNASAIRMACVRLDALEALADKKSED